MTPSNSSNERSSEPLELRDALAAIIANTRRVKRKLNLIEIAQKISIARKYLKRAELAEKVDLSDEMIREFESVHRLSRSVQSLIEGGKLQSVDVVDRISRLPSKDQIIAANQVLAGKLSSKDLRALVSLKNSVPGLEISVAIERIKRSRNIREYVAQLAISKRFISQKLAKERLEQAFGASHLRSFSLKRGIATIVLDQEAKRALEASSRKRGATKRAILQSIILAKGNR